MEEKKEIKEQGNKKVLIIAGIIGFIVGFTLTVVIGIMYVNSKYDKKDDTKTTNTTTKETSTTTTTTTTKAVELDNGHKDYPEADHLFNNEELFKCTGKDNDKHCVYKTDEFELIVNAYYELESIIIGKKKITNLHGEILTGIHRFKYFLVIEYSGGLDGAGYSNNYYFYDYEGNLLFQPDTIKVDNKGNVKSYEEKNDLNLVGYEFDINTLDLNVYYIDSNYSVYYDGYLEGDPIPKEQCNLIKNRDVFGRVELKYSFNKENNKFSDNPVVKGEKEKDNKDIKDACLKEYKIDITK